MAQSPLFDFYSTRMPLEEREREKKSCKKKKVIVIAGPTASGKTKLSLLIAQAIGGEIISADSMQIYRGADIGGAKPALEELRAIPHHLIDIRDIDEDFNVVNFYEEATGALQDILLREKVPIVAGGAGFYIHTLLYGPPKGPPADKEVREKLEADYEKYGAERFYEKLKELDPDYASTITMLDRQKIVRALEIITLTGMRVSEIPKPSQEDLSQEYDFRCWFIYYPKEVLYKRIEERCDQMIALGLTEEVIALRRKGLEQNRSASHSIGYRQYLDFLKSPQTKEDWEEFIRKFKKASRNYAKRQFTWFRREPLFRWLDLSQSSLEHIAEIIIQDFEQY